MQTEKNKQTQGLQLSKNSTSEIIKGYFGKILKLKQSGQEFPVNIDEVWPLVFTRRENAFRELKKSFIEDEDYQLRQNDEVVKMNDLKNGVRIDAYLTVACMEYFIAKKVKPVFDVYRKVFHAAINSTQAQKQLKEEATYTEGEYFNKKLGETMILGTYFKNKPFFLLNKILSFIGYSDSSNAGSFARKVNSNNVVLIPAFPGGKQKQWFINHEGFSQMLVYSSPDISSRRVEQVYGDLFRKTIDGNAITPTRHPYKFTHEEMNVIFYEISKIGRVKLQNSIYELLRGGLKS